MLLETQQINRAIAEALTAQGFERRLLWVWWHDEGQFEGEPKDFTDPRTLLPALEAWTDKNHAGWTLWKWQVNNDSPSITHAASVFIVYGDRWEGASNEPFEALRNAFAAALGVNI